MTKIDEKRLYYSKEVEEMLGVSKATLRYYRGIGQLISSKIGINHLYEGCDIANFIKNRKQEKRAATPKTL